MAVSDQAPAYKVSHVGALLVSAILIALCVILIWQARQLAEQHQWVERAYQGRVELEELERSLREAESTQRALIIVGDAQGRDLMASFETLLLEVLERKKNIESQISRSPSQTKRAKMLGGLVQARLQQLKTNARELHEADRQVRQSRILEGALKGEAISKLLDEIREEEDRLLLTRMQAANQTEKNVVWLAVTGSGLGVIVMALMAMAQRRQRDQTLAYQERLVAARDTALDSASAMSNFVASVSHEIRTPMNGVLGAADLLRRDERMSKDQIELIDNIMASGRSLLELINDILDLSRLRSGAMEPDAEEFDVSNLLDEVFAVFSSGAGRKRLELSAKIEPEVPVLIDCDRRRLKQALVNLIGNAVKFTDRGGVCVEVGWSSPEPDKRILRVRVVDTGPGISEQDQARLFEPFCRGNVALSRRHPGTGLGLAITKEIIQQLGGAIGVESTVGKGTAFWFTIPAQEATSSCSMFTSLDSRGRLLLLESREQTAQSITMHAARWGLGMVHLKQLKQLQEFDDEGPWEAIIVGELDGCDPRELLAKISGKPSLAKAALYLLAPPDGPGPAEWLKTEKVSACLRYPFRASELYDLLAKDEVKPVQPVLTRSITLPESRILLVEDHPVNQRVFGRQLKALGMQVEICGDGPEGVEARKSGGFDLILMDCQLPTMEGVEATRLIRQWELQQNAPRIPIVAVTAHVMAGVAEECFQAGMDDYLSKPFDLERLERVLGRWLIRTDPSVLLASQASGLAHAEVELINRTALDECLTGELSEDRELLELLFAETAKRVEDMRAALEQAGEEPWKRSAHQAKGSLATMGMNSLAALFAKADQQMPPEEQAMQLLEQIEQQLKLTRQALRKSGLL